MSSAVVQPQYSGDFGLPPTDILAFPLDKAPDATIQINYLGGLAWAPGSAEQRLMFQMLDALALTTPIDQWEH